MGLYEQNYLMHHGVKGQKWGERNGPPYPLDSSISTGSTLRSKGGSHYTMITDHEHDNEVKTGPYNRGNNLTEDEFKAQYIKKCERVIDKELKNINRRFKEGYQWQYNCGNCTIATELLSHGIGATAKSNWEYGLFPEVLEKGFGVEKYEVVKTKSYKEISKDIEDTIKKQGSNSSGSIQVYWGGESGNGGAHYIHYTNAGGKITIEDGQEGIKFSDVKSAMNEYALTPDRNGNYYCEVVRLDNGTPNYDVLQNYVNLRRK